MYLVVLQKTFNLLIMRKFSSLITQIVFTIVLISVTLSALAQNELTPKREFRAAWIATVENIDWPSNSRIGSDAQKKEYIEMIDKLQAAGLNTLIVQVRPASDAFYASEYEPWSQWLSGFQGIEPTPFYDPLQFMIEEAHKRNLEFHAWINPFRAVVNVEKTVVADNHISIVNPTYCFTYGKNMYLDPGIPAVRDHVVNVVTDIVKRYDVDGIHIDDYFYPYKIKDLDIPDSLSFLIYSGNFPKEAKDDWRRENINKFIQSLYESIHNTKPYVKFGISPFGVWKNKSQDENGSDTKAFSCYEGLFADSRKWAEEGWLDYMAPQIYWHRDFAAAEYDILADWWNNNSFNRHLYIGLAAYRAEENAKDEKWLNPSEIPSQIRLNRSLKNVGGEIFFSAKSLIRNNLGIADSLQTNLYKYPALVPTMEWLDAAAPTAVSNIVVEKLSKKYSIKWDKPTIAMPEAIDTAAYYVIYRVEGENTVDINNPANIYTILRTNEMEFSRQFALKKKKYSFVITAVDRMHNESPKSAAFVLKLK